jgi:hypothetical protein
VICSRRREMDEEMNIDGNDSSSYRPATDRDLLLPPPQDDAAGDVVGVVGPAAALNSAREHEEEHEEEVLPPYPRHLHVIQGKFSGSRVYGLNFKSFSFSNCRSSRGRLRRGSGCSGHRGGVCPWTGRKI